MPFLASEKLMWNLYHNSSSITGFVISTFSSSMSHMLNNL